MLHDAHSNDRPSITPSITWLAIEQGRAIEDMPAQEFLRSFAVNIDHERGVARSGCFNFIPRGMARWHSRVFLTHPNRPNEVALLEFHPESADGWEVAMMETGLHHPAEAKNIKTMKVGALGTSTILTLNFT